ncbi:hypothetical protein D3C87_1732550 [compost metagenome]
MRSNGIIPAEQKRGACFGSDPVLACDGCGFRPHGPPVWLPHDGWPDSGSDVLRDLGLLHGADSERKVSDRTGGGSAVLWESVPPDLPVILAGARTVSGHRPPGDALGWGVPYVRRGQKLD